MIPTSSGFHRSDIAFAWALPISRLPDWMLLGAHSEWISLDRHPTAWTHNPSRHGWQVLWKLADTHSSGSDSHYSDFDGIHHSSRLSPVNGERKEKIEILFFFSTWDSCSHHLLLLFSLLNCHWFSHWRVSRWSSPPYSSTAGLSLQVHGSDRLLLAPTICDPQSEFHHFNLASAF